MEPLVRHGRPSRSSAACSSWPIGVAMVFDWLACCRATSTSTRRSEWPTDPSSATSRERHGLIGPFSGRQLAMAFVAVLVAVIVLIGVTTPLGNTATGPGTVDPRATAYIISSPPPIGLKAGATAPEFAGTQWRRHDLPADRSRRQADPPGRPAWQGRLDQLLRRPGARPASPRCRSCARSPRRTRTAASCSSPSASRRPRPTTWPPTRLATSFRTRSGSMATARSSGPTRPTACPTQLFIDPNGVIASIVGAPLDEAGAAAHIEPILPLGGQSLTLKPGGVHRMRPEPPEHPGPRTRSFRWFRSCETSSGVGCFGRRDDAVDGRPGSAASAGSRHAMVPLVWNYLENGILDDEYFESCASAAHRDPRRSPSPGGSRPTGQSGS